MNKYILIGNGFSIDLMKRLGNTKINLTNLFSNGDQLIFPKTDEKGFLSAKNCPNLWTLGVNSTIDDKKSIQLINNIITCANVYNLSKRSSNNEETKSIYIKAYYELSSYLRYLFIYYNSLVNDEDLKNVSSNIPIVQYIKKSLEKGYKINIISYNYDIWLERLLKVNNLEFSINPFDKEVKQIEIFKPHGSISFSLKTKVAETAPYKIKFFSDDITQSTTDFDVIYKFENDYPIVNAIIPPAGDSMRYKYGWNIEIKKKIIDCINNSCNNDEMIIYGISYWHVDRNEIDDIIININSDIDLKHVDPFPASEFSSVLSSLFDKYVHYTNGNLIV